MKKPPRAEMAMPKPKRKGNEDSKMEQRTESRALDELSQSRIGQQLKAFYADVASEPVPRKFHDLLKSLEDAEKDNADE